MMIHENEKMVEEIDDFDHNINSCCASIGNRIHRHDYIVNHLIYEIDMKKRL